MKRGDVCRGMVTKENSYQMADVNGKIASPANTSGSPAPLRTLLLITAVFTLFGTPIAIWACRQAWSDWHAVTVDGFVIQSQCAEIKGSRGAFDWRVVWDVQCDSELGHLSVRDPSPFRSEEDASVGAREAIGRRVTVWYTPGNGGVGNVYPPEWTRSLLEAILSLFAAAVGWLGVAAFVQLAWKRVAKGLDTK